MAQIQPSGFYERITEVRFLKPGDQFRFNSEPNHSGCVIMFKGERVIVDIDLSKPEFNRMNQECTILNELSIRKKLDK